VIDSLENLGGRISRTNWVLFPLVAVASLRPSLTKEAHQRFNVLTQTPQTKEWFEQRVEVGHDAELGYPNPMDEVVLMGLIEISRLQQHASGPITTTQDQILEVLRWRRWAWYHKRLDKALQRWSKVTLKFETAKFDLAGRGIPGTIPILASAETKGETYVFEWSESVQVSLKAAVSTFNLRDYLLFDNAIARRIYQLTHQSLAEQGSKTLPLREFAEKDIRLRLGYSLGRIRCRLGKAIAELENKGYLRPAEPDARFPIHDDGEPTICLKAGPMFHKPKPRNRVTSADQLEIKLDEAADLPPLRTPLPPTRPEPVALQGITKANSDKPVQTARDLAIDTFWQSLSPEKRVEEESRAMTLANGIQRETLQQNSLLAEAVRKDLLHIHALRLMVMSSDA